MGKKKTNKTKRSYEEPTEVSSYEEPTEVSFRDHLKKKPHGS